MTIPPIKDPVNPQPPKPTPPNIPGLTIPEKVRAAWGNLGYISLITGPYNILYGIIDTIVKFKKAWNPKNETPERVKEIRTDAYWAAIRNCGKISRGTVSTINGLYLTRVIGVQALKAAGPLTGLATLLSFGGIAFESNGISYSNDYIRKIKSVQKELKKSRTDHEKLMIYQTFMQGLAEESTDRFGRLGLRLEVSKDNIVQLVKGYDAWSNLSEAEQKNKIGELLKVTEAKLAKIEKTLKKQNIAHYMSIASYVGNIASTVCYFLSFTVFPPLILVGLLLDFAVFFLDVYSTYYSIVKLQEPADMFLLGKLWNGKREAVEDNLTQKLSDIHKLTHYKISTPKLNAEQMTKFSKGELFQLGSRAEALRFSRKIKNVNNISRFRVDTKQNLKQQNESLHEHMVTRMKVALDNTRQKLDLSREISRGQLLDASSKIGFVFQRVMSDSRRDPIKCDIVPFQYDSSFYSEKEMKEGIAVKSLDKEIEQIAERMANHYLKGLQQFLENSPALAK